MQARRPVRPCPLLSDRYEPDLFLFDLGLGRRVVDPLRFGVLRPILDERAQRLWTASEAWAYGRGGVVLVHEATGMAESTIRVGLREIAEGPVAVVPGSRGSDEAVVGASALWRSSLAWWRRWRGSWNWQRAGIRCLRCAGL